VIRSATKAVLGDEGKAQGVKWLTFEVRRAARRFREAAHAACHQGRANVPAM
jgi:hypothetical protein